MIFRVVVMVSLKPIERIVRYKIGLEFLGRREGEGPDAPILEVLRVEPGRETSVMRRTAARDRR